MPANQRAKANERQLSEKHTMNSFTEIPTGNRIGAALMAAVWLIAVITAVVSGGGSGLWVFSMALLASVCALMPIVAYLLADNQHEREVAFGVFLILLISLPAIVLLVSVLSADLEHDHHKTTPPNHCIS